jgi:uncharacterized sulfatase
MPEEELYDLEEDPHQVRNLATSERPDHRKALLDLRARLELWVIETADQGRQFEPDAVARAQGATQPKRNGK